MKTYNERLNSIKSTLITLGIFAVVCTVATILPIKPVNTEATNTDNSVSEVPAIRTSTGFFTNPDEIETYDGHVWLIDEDSLFPQNDVCVVFDTKSTNDITDDVIIGITIIE